MNETIVENVSSVSTVDTYLIVMIIALFISMLVLGYFVYKFSNQNREFARKIRKSKEIEKSQSSLLANMSEDIYTLTQNLVEEQTVSTTNKIEDEILNSANNLRELLKIKSNKVEVFRENFSFSHMLDDISRYIASNFKDRETEVIFNIDKSVPRYLTGDVLHLSRILNNILEFTIQATPYGKVTVNISCGNAVNNKLMLNIEIIDTSKGLDDKSLAEAFTFVYDEKMDKHKGLRLYIAKELTRAIEGVLKLTSVLGAGNTFVFNAPMHINDNSYRKFKLENRDKKVLIFSKKVATGLSLKKLFSCFYDDVSVEHQERRVSCINYDLIILDDIFFDDVNMEHLAVIKDNKDIKVVAFSSIFSQNRQSENPLIDKYMKVPSNPERVFDLISNLELSEIPEAKETISTNQVINKKKTDKLEIYRKSVEETKGISVDSFKDFTGSRLLIVEDNLINQKILISVVRKSGIEIEIANNGQEALDILFVEKKSFDIVLMDISMPVMDGLVATQKIRDNSSFNNLPIITFTAFAMGEEIEQMFQAGVNSYLTKPLNIKKLYTIFSMFLEKKEPEVIEKEEIIIDGLDIHKGIIASDKSEALYKETLKEFIVAYKDMITLMPKWIEDKEYNSVKVSCRDMQGILGMIGAYEMKEVVDEMERNILHCDDTYMQKYILLYPKLLKKLITSIDEYLVS